MAHNEAYTKIWREAGNGLALHDVARCLGVSSKDLGTLCQSPAINKWAKYKPVRYSNIGEINDTIRSWVDFGFDTSGIYGVDTSDATLLSLMRNAIANGGEWAYLKPRGRGYGEWFRLLDFDKYNHLAEAPYYVISHGIILENGGTFALECDKRTSENVEIDIRTMGSFLAPDTEHAISDYRLGVITLKGNDVRLFLSSRTLDQLFTLPGEEVNVNIANGEGTTYALFVFTTIDPGDIDATGHLLAEPESGEAASAGTIWLPGCLQTYVVSAIINAVTGDGGFPTSGEGYCFFKAHVDADGLPQRVETALRLQNGTGSAQEVSVYLEVQYPDGDGGIIVSGETKQSLDNTIDEGDTVTAVLPDINVPEPISTEDGYDISNIAVKVRWEWTDATTHRRWFDFAEGRTVSTDPGFMTLDEVKLHGYARIDE